MSRVPPTPVLVYVEKRWHVGTLYSCEPSDDGGTCSGEVSLHEHHGDETDRFPAHDMRSITGVPGCPADHADRTCGESGTLGP
jgi:hypothetical protein